jgi:hypothetical protein
MMYIFIMKTYIYTLEHPITKEVKYVGKTNNTKRRLHYHWAVGHKSNNKLGQWLKSLKTQKIKPNLNIIDETDNEWIWLEQYWISQFKTWGFDLKNHTEGGEGCYGGGQWHLKQVSVYDKQGKYIQTFNSVNECANYFKVPHGTISSVLSGRVRLLLKTYQIRYGNDFENVGVVKPKKKRKKENPLVVRGNCKPIICLTDNLIFNSTTEASKYYKILITSINNILNGKAKKTRCGKKFRYV